MPRRLPYICALALCAALLCASLALAAAPPPALEGADIEAAAAAKNAKATPSLNPITAVNAMNQSIRASEQQTKAAVESMAKAESRPAKAAAPRPGGGKVIYGDIIIHK